jgi:hypothetical protein
MLSRFIFVFGVQNWATLHSMKIAPIYLLLVLFFCCLRANAQYQTGERTIPCKTPANASMCYWTHGRLGFGNGTPALRLWKIGTNRILGIYSGPSTYNPAAKDPDHGDNEHPQLPFNVVQAMWHKERAYKIPDRIFADFEVCPLEPEEAGTMQATCVQTAKNIVTEK